MAKTIKCYDCGAKVSLQGNECKKCGAPLEHSLEMYEQQRERKSRFRSYVIGALAILMGFAVVVNGGFLAFFVLLLAGVLIMPITNELIENFNPYDTGGLLKGVGWGLAVVGFFLAMSAMKEHHAENPRPVRVESPKPVTPTEPKPDPSITDPAKKIEAGAVIPYTKEHFPTLYAKYGDNGLQAFSQHNEESALLVASLLECDMVEYAGHSDKSEYPIKLVSFVDCKNGKRFVISHKKIIEMKNR